VPRQELKERRRVKGAVHFGVLTEKRAH
jgi:hypothetical protein